MLERVSENDLIRNFCQSQTKLSHIHTKATNTSLSRSASSCVSRTSHVSVSKRCCIIIIQMLVQMHAYQYNQNDLNGLNPNSLLLHRYLQAVDYVFKISSVQIRLTH